MLTPQQLQDISFEKVRFGGYDMSSVDELLEPLTEDYVTLYKENSILKSKMRILVEKLEDYRRQEASMQNAILAAQKTSEDMVKEAEKKCAKMLREAQETAQAKAQNVDSLVDTEKERLEVAQEMTAKFIDGMEKRLKRQLELLEELRSAELPKKAEKAEKPEKKQAFDFDKEPSAPSTQEKADAFIEEIGAQVEAAIAQEEKDEPAKAANPMSDTLHGELSPAKQKLLSELRFGRNYENT